MKARSKRFVFHLLFIYSPAAILFYIAIVYSLVRLSANRDEAQHADLIIVFGAAQYNGRPSPVFKARLDHTANLFKKKMARRIMTTGGYGFDVRFSEAAVGKNYLMKQEIPGELIFTEETGLTTLSSIEEILEFLHLQRMTRVIAVSDGFHLFRIKQILGDHDIRVYGSPAENSPIESRLKSRVWASLREVLGYTAYWANTRLGLPIPAGGLV